MSDRFQELYRIQPNLFIEGSPVLIEAGALLKDTVTDKVLALVKIKNLESKKVTACRVAIRAFGPDGTEMEGLSDYLYVDINAEIGQNFGAKIPVYLPDKNSRKMSVSVTQVVFDDETVWNHEPCEWLQVPEQQYISNYFPDHEFTYQYELEVGPECTFVPVSRNGLFQCTCGATNLAAADRCYHCNRNYEDLIAKMDLDYLADHIAIRQAEEKAAAEAEEARRIAEEKAAEKRRLAAEEKRKKQKKIVKVSAIAVLVVAIAIIAVGGITYKIIVPNNKYNAAVTFMENGDYEAAIKAFDELGDYKDSAERKTEAQKASIYAEAESLFENERYEEALPLYTDLTDYKDSSERVETIQSILDKQYNDFLLSAYSVAEQDIYLAGEYLDKIPDSYSPAKSLRELYQRYSPYSGLFDAGGEEFQSVFTVSNDNEVRWRAVKTDDSYHVFSIANMGLSEWNEVYGGNYVEVHFINDSGKPITTSVQFSNNVIQITTTNTLKIDGSNLSCSAVPKQ